MAKQVGPGTASGAVTRRSLRRHGNDRWSWRSRWCGWW